MFRLRPEHTAALAPRAADVRVARLLARLGETGLVAEHDAGAGVVLARDQRGNVSRIPLREDGTPLGVTSPSGRTFEIEARADHRLSSVVLPGGERLELDYDERGRPLSLARPGLLTYRIALDEQDRLERLEHPDGTSTRIGYAPSGLASYTDRTGATTSYAHDDVSDSVAVQDTLGRTTRFVAAELGLLRRIEHADGSSETFSHDGVTRRDGRRVAHERDAEGRLVAFVFPDGVRRDVAMDQAQRRVSLSEGPTSLVVREDEDGRPLEETTEAGTVTYTYDADGRLSGLTTPFGDEIRYRHDADGRIEAIVDWQGRAILFDRDVSGPITAIRFPGGVTERREYGRVGGFTRAVVEDGDGTLLSEQHYEYDLCDRLTSITDIWGPSLDERESRRFEHDAEGRLYAEIDRRSEEVLGSWDYDAKGNMTLDGSRRVAVGPMDNVLRSGDDELIYDELGNVTGLPGSDGRRMELRWAESGTLRSATTGSRTVSFEYDPMGRRTRKTDGQSTWRYGWAGAMLLWEEHTAAPGAPAVRRDYLYDGDGLALLAFREDGKTYWVQTDVRKAPVRVVDEAGNVVWRARYTSFGEARIEVAQVRVPQRLAGQYEDEETGLHYNVARYYCPWLKTYLSMDPSWSSFGATNYSYAANDPWNKVDPSGAIAFLVFVGFAIVGALINMAITAATGHGSLLGAAISGAILGAAAPIGMSALTVVAAAVISSFAASVVQQWFDKGWAEICWQCALLEGAISGALARLTFGLTKLPWFQRAGRWIAGKIRVPLSATAPSWSLGGFKSLAKWERQMAKRGWSSSQISEAIVGGKSFPAENLVNPGGTATRYVHPQTGRSVVLDDVTNEVIHVGGDGFGY